MLQIGRKRVRGCTAVTAALKTLGEMRAVKDR